MNTEERNLSTEEDKKQTSKNEKSGINKIISFIRHYVFGQPDPYYENRKLLKTIEKKIKKVKPMIYDFKRERVTPEFAKIIYEVYKTVHPAKKMSDMMKSNKNKGLVQLFFVEYSMTKEQREILDTLSEEYIIDEITRDGFNKASKSISKRENELIKSFNKESVFETNKKYSTLFDLVELISYDYYPLLKKFDKNLSEDSLIENPSFSSASGKYLVEDLKILSGIINDIDLSSPLGESAEMFAKFKNKELMYPTEIEKLIKMIKKIDKNEYITLLIRIIDENPFYRPKKGKESYNIFQNYSELINSRIKTYVKHAREEQIKSQVNILLKKLFGKTEIETLKNYTEGKNSMLERFDIKRYTYASPLSCLKYFVMEKYNRYIRETINSLLLGANFYKVDIQKTLSNYFYGVNDLIKEIISLDESLDEKEPRGHRFKILLRKASNETQSKKLANEYVAQINNDAAKILNSAKKSMEFIAGLVHKILEENKDRKKLTIISNLKDVEGARNKEFVENLEKTVNDMGNIIRFINFYIKFNSEEG